MRGAFERPADPFVMRVIVCALLGGRPVGLCPAHVEQERVRHIPRSVRPVRAKAFRPVGALRRGDCGPISTDERTHFVPMHDRILPARDQTSSMARVVTNEASSAGPWKISAPRSGQNDAALA